MKGRRWPAPSVCYFHKLVQLLMKMLRPPLQWCFNVSHTQYRNSQKKKAIDLLIRFKGLPTLKVWVQLKLKVLLIMYINYLVHYFFLDWLCAIKITKKSIDGPMNYLMQGYLKSCNFFICINISKLHLLVG